MIADAQMTKTHGRRKSRTYSSPYITGGFTTTRKNRSSFRAETSDGGVIAIDSSSDEGEDTSIDAPNDSNDTSEVSFSLTYTTSYDLAYVSKLTSWTPYLRLSSRSLRRDE